VFTLRSLVASIAITSVVALIAFFSTSLRALAFARSVVCVALGPFIETGSAGERTLALLCCS
jgi:hypothetical protein